MALAPFALIFTLFAALGATGDIQAQTPPSPNPAPRQPQVANVKVNAPRPPRVDGVYLGANLGFQSLWADTVDVPPTAAMLGWGFDLRIGEVIYPWLALGLQVGGGAVRNELQRYRYGHLMLESGLYPFARVPLSVRLALGIGFGAVRDKRWPDRLGVGGATMRTGLRYEFFPLASRFRPKRGGGLSLAPEISAVITPGRGEGRAAIYGVGVSLWAAYYFGR